MNGPTVQSIRNYACHTLALRAFLERPGDRRSQPEIPASTFCWALLIGPILRIASANRLEYLAHFANRKLLAFDSVFGDDALAYFTERLDPDVIRRQLAATLKLAKYNKVFDHSPLIGLAIDGTGAGRTTKPACTLCHPVKDAQGNTTSRLHYFTMISVVGTGITLPFDIEPYAVGDSEYSAGQRLLKRAIELLGKSFADYVVVDAKFATAPYLEAADALGIPVVARLKENLPELSSAVERRFSTTPPKDIFPLGNDTIEAWDADDFAPWATLHWPAVRAFRYRQHKPDGTIVQADWITKSPGPRWGTRTAVKTAKSRWEIENQGFNEAKNLYNIEHIQHHHPNSMLVNWLLVVLALVIERLFRLRFLHRGTHPRMTAMQLKDRLWFALSLPPSEFNTS